MYFEVFHMTLDEYNALPRDAEGRTRLYRTWDNMNSRCFHESKQNFHRYGGRGITVCPEWRGGTGFIAFRDFALTHGWEPDLEIDRIDNDGNYDPSNVKFSTKIEQARNRCTNRLITLGGRTKCLQEWCDIFAIARRLFYSRVGRGWSELAALVTPPRRAAW